MTHLDHTNTVKREMLVAIIFGGFENITIWLRFNLAISLKLSGWGPYFFQLATTNFGEISPNKSSPIIYRFTVQRSVCGQKSFGSLPAKCMSQSVPYIPFGSLAHG